MGRITFEKTRLLSHERKITSYTVKKREDVKISQSTWQQVQRDELSVTTRTIAELCKLFNCQPGDLMEYVEDDSAADHEQKDGD